MKWNKANLAGLTSPGQQSEMKSILAGTWPPLKPLPVFKYETVEYRATIDFDRKRGEWVCRKTSLPSNEVQELRGGLREITMALPRGEEEMLIEGAEQQEQELEKDTNRRLQALHDWREKYENGARYFELRDFLSESQRTEFDDSLRLTLTARQLQFNPKNLANIFDDLSVAGGRFGTLIEFAKRNKAKQGTAPQAQGEAALPEAEPAIDHDDKQVLEASPPESGHVLNNIEPNNIDRLVPNQEAAEPCSAAEEFPAVSIKDVFPEPDQASLAEQMARAAAQQFEIETSATASQQFETEIPEIEEADSPLLIEPPLEEGHHSPAFSVLAAQVRTAHSSADRIEGSSSRFPHLEISAFQVGILALLFLSAVIAFVVGLKAGRDPLGGPLRETPKLMLASDAKPPTLPDQADVSTSRTPTPPVGTSDASAGAQTQKERKTLDDAIPLEEKSKESPRGSDLAEVGPTLRSTDADWPPPAESKPSAKPEVNSEHSGAIGPVVRNVSPPEISKPVRRPKAVRSIHSTPRGPAPYRLPSTIGAAPHLTRPSTILVTFPGQESQPNRVRFPEKAIAATSSFAMTSQLSVLVSPEPGATLAHKPARLEAGKLVSFGWPRYPRPKDRKGLAETIRVRATIGQLGQVQDVKFLSGSASLLPATMEAVRQWRYTPTLLDKRPVQAQQDVTIEFRPPQSPRYSSPVSTQHPSHN